MTSLTVNSIGTQVVLNDGIAHIISVWIKGKNQVVYQLGWWAGNDYKTDYFSDWQFMVDNGGKLKIGFNPMPASAGVVYKD